MIQSTLEYKTEINEVGVKISERLATWVCKETKRNTAKSTIQSTLKYKIGQGKK